MRGRKGMLLYSQIREIEQVWEKVRECDATGKTVLDMTVRFKTTPEELRKSGFNVIESGLQQMRIVLSKSTK